MSTATAPRSAKAKKEELSNEDIQPQSRSDFDIPVDDIFSLPKPDVITPEQATKMQLDGLLFAEQPVRFYINPPSEEFGAMFVPCWNQGKGGEVYDLELKQWREVTTIPRGVDVISRVKYLEIILRSKITDVRHVGKQNNKSEPVNSWGYTSRHNFPVQLVGKHKPEIMAWFEAMSRTRA